MNRLELLGSFADRVDRIAAGRLIELSTRLG